MKKILFAVMLAALIGCEVDEPRATNFLINQGYTNVRVNTTAIGGCPGDGEYGAEFWAKNSNGKDVSGIVCEYGDTYTIRFR